MGEHVSIILPARNEVKYIEKCLHSILMQDYPKDKLEVLVVDGMSEDGTRQTINIFQNRDSRIKCIDNVLKTTPVALNLGIRMAKGEYIVRMDAHTNYPQDYVSKCIEYAIKTGAENVGGVWEHVGQGYIGSVAAMAMSSKFGLGGAKFRTAKKEQYVDTVPFGCFKRSVFDRLGMFNEKLVRNQDIEFNSRIRKAGGKILLTPQIKSFYYCRENLFDLWKQNFANGYWNILTIKENPGALSLRHFVPLLFVLSLMTFWLYLPLWLGVIGAYTLVNLFNSLQISMQKGFKYFPIMPIVFIVLHFSYGIGSIWGLFCLVRIKR